MTLDQFFREEYAKLGLPPERFEAVFLRAKALWGTHDATLELSQEELEQMRGAIMLLKVIRVSHPEGKKILTEIKNTIGERLTNHSKKN